MGKCLKFVLIRDFSCIAKRCRKIVLKDVSQNRFEEGVAKLS